MSKGGEGWRPPGTSNTEAPTASCGRSVEQVRSPDKYKTASTGTQLDSGSHVWSGNRFRRETNDGCHRTLVLQSFRYLSIRFRRWGSVWCPVASDDTLQKRDLTLMQLLFMQLLLTRSRPHWELIGIHQVTSNQSPVTQQHMISVCYIVDTVQLIHMSSEYSSSSVTTKSSSCSSTRSSTSSSGGDVM